MSLIKFPSNIKPSRVTVQLQRVDEIFASPLSNIQQVVSRGNPAWRWTYEYRDISENEREVVQAFLMNCRGALNTFKVTDPGEYSGSGSSSLWADRFEGKGYFASVSSPEQYWLTNNSYFTLFPSNPDGVLKIQANLQGPSERVCLQPSMSGSAMINSLEVGKAYTLRYKAFVGNGPMNLYTTINPNSGDNRLAPYDSTTNVQSDAVVSIPFVTPVNTLKMQILHLPSSSWEGDAFGIADVNVARCLMVSNSENLLTHSRAFNSDWIFSQASLVTSFGTDPLNKATSSVKLLCNSTANFHYMRQENISKVGSNAWFTAAIRVRPAEYSKIGIEIGRGGSTRALAQIDVTSGASAVDSHWSALGIHLPIARVTDLNNEGWHKCELTALVDTVTDIDVYFYPVNTNGDLAFAGAASGGIEIALSQFENKPFSGRYTFTETSAVVGSSNPQVGSTLCAALADPNTLVARAGHRFEIINRYFDTRSNYYERSEFKRLTKDAVAGPDGNVTLHFDPPIRNAGVPQIYPNQNGGMQLFSSIIFNKPEMKARLLNGTIQYIEKQLQLTDIVFDVIEDLTE